MARPRLRSTLIVSLALCAACADDDPDSPSGVVLQGNTACERYASLAAAKGCSPPTSCTVAAQCDSDAVTWIDCIATDLDQCICEADGDLNCEGSYKSDEGPARCVATFTAYDTCTGM